MKIEIFGMLQHVDWWMVTDVADEHSAFIVRV
jgi:hypothetical protein